MGLRDYIKTIQDMEQLFYGNGSKHIQKSDAPVISTTTGVYNAVFGAQVWSQLNQEANAFAALPKYPWTRSGWRVITARASTSGGGGVAENGALPDTVKPTFAELSTKPKTMAITFDVSEIQHFLSAESDDDAVGDLEMMRPLSGVQHAEDINIALLKDVDTLAGNNFESVDRVCSSKSEEDALLTAGDADIYSIDRSDANNSWADAQVDHNSGVDRVLTDTLIRDLLNDVRSKGGMPTFWITGWDTYTKIQSIYQDQVRYNPLGIAKVSLSVNGVQTAEGIEVGIDITTLYGIPLIISKNTPVDTISRIYLLDTSDPEGFGIPRLGVRVAKPTQYFEAGMDANNKDPFGINRLGSEGMYRTMAELICTFFAVQGKIRDLKSV